MGSSSLEAIMTHHQLPELSLFLTTITASVSANSQVPNYHRQSDPNRVNFHPTGRPMARAADRTTRNRSSTGLLKIVARTSR